MKCRAPLWSEKRHADCLEQGRARHLHRMRRDYIIQTLRETREEKGEAVRVLDIGCGDGVITRALRSVIGPGDEVVGIDFDFRRLLRAKEALQSVPLAQAEATDIPFKPETFDFVVLHHVIEHILDDERVLVECQRILSPSGVLLVGVPNEDGPVGRFLRRIHPGLYRRSEHVHFYSTTSMGKLLGLAGFHVTKRATFGMLFPNYYAHYLLMGFRWVFGLGHRLAQRWDSLADSLIFVARKAEAVSFDEKSRQESCLESVCPSSGL